MPLTVPEIAVVRTQNPRLADALDKIVNEINLTQKATGVAPAGRLPNPTLASIAVAANDGIFDAQLSDPAVEQPGTSYFLEYSTSPEFPSASTHVSGPHSGRNISGLNLGNQTYYFRAYSAFPGGTATSPIVVFGGTTPTGVAGGGTQTPPPLSAGQGSGTSQAPGFGFGTPPNQIPNAGRKRSLI